MDTLRHGKANRLTTWAALLSWMFVTLLPIGGLALCFGTDGHIGINQLAAQSDTCPCLPYGLDSDREDVNGSADRHPPCADLAFELPESVRSLVANSRDDAEDTDPVPPPVAIATDRPCALDASILARQRQPAARLPSATPLQKRTRVLLI